jgi:hypothetical protein
VLPAAAAVRRCCVCAGVDAASRTPCSCSSESDSSVRYLTSQDTVVSLDDDDDDTVVSLCVVSDQEVMLYTM